MEFRIPCDVHIPEPKSLGARSDGDRLNICFLALRGYGLLARRHDLPHVGGAEVQQLLLGRGLVRRGHAVSFLVLDHGQPDRSIHDGIQAFKTYSPAAGVRGLRRMHPQLTGLWSAMRRSGAQVFYQRGADWETGVAALWCRWARRPFVFGVAHDADCMSSLPYLPSRFDQLFFRYGVRHTDAVVAQTARQQDLLRESWGVESELVRSACELPDDQAFDRADSPPHNGRVLWIGRFSPEKRPDWVVRLARAFPQRGFDVVGQCNASSGYGWEVASALRSLPNVEWHGFVPRERMGEFYRRAAVLLCTSAAEGFPNIFLEAWGWGLPVLATVDPDDLIERNRLGWYAETFEEMCALFQRGVMDVEAAHDAARIREFVERRHSVDAAVEAIECILRRVVRRRGRSTLPKNVHADSK